MKQGVVVGWLSQNGVAVDGGNRQEWPGGKEFGSAADNTTRGLGPTGWSREVVRRAGCRGSEKEDKEGGATGGQRRGGEKRAGRLKRRLDSGSVARPSVRLEACHTH